MFALLLEAAETDETYKNAMAIIEGTKKASDFENNPLRSYGSDSQIQHLRVDWSYDHKLLYRSGLVVVPQAARAPFLTELVKTHGDYSDQRIMAVQRIYWWPNMRTDLLALTNRR